MSTVNQIKGNTSVEETLEQIYREVPAMGLSPAEHAEVNKLIVSTFQAGIDWALSADSLEGFSNLTVAIKDNEPVDWEKLEGRKTQCVSPGIGEARGVLARRVMLKPDLPDAWWKDGMDYIYVNALYEAWYGRRGWTLWVEGEIPLRRKTADQLEVGTYFITSVESRKYLMYVGGWDSEGRKTIHFAPAMGVSNTPASEWVVLEELGPCGFVEPEGK